MNRDLFDHDSNARVSCSQRGMPSVSAQSRNLLFPILIVLIALTTSVLFESPVLGRNLWQRVSENLAVGEHAEGDTEPALWLTLSESIEPATLAGRLTDPTDNQARFLDVVGDQATPEHLDQVETFLDGSRNPHLVPAWLAWSAFAHRFIDFEGAEARERLGLTSHGMTANGIELVVAAAHRVNAHEATLSSEIQPALDALIELVREAASSIGATAAQDAAEAGDAAVLADATRFRRGVVEEWLATGLRSPAAEAATHELQALVEALVPEDWRLLRGYLRSEVAPGIQVFDVDTFLAESSPEGES